jgi:hypothetical protein
MKLEEIATGQSLSGIEPADIVSVVALVPLAEGSVQLIYRTPNGAMKERLLGRADEASIAIASNERPFSFNGDGAPFQLACEAKRIDLAFLFDPMMAVTAQDHKGNQPPDGALAVGVEPEELGDVPDGCSFGLDLPSLGGYAGA